MALGGEEKDKRSASREGDVMFTVIILTRLIYCLLYLKHILYRARERKGAVRRDRTGRQRDGTKCFNVMTNAGTTADYRQMLPCFPAGALVIHISWCTLQGCMLLFVHPLTPSSAAHVLTALYKTPQFPSSLVVYGKVFPWQDKEPSSCMKGTEHDKVKRCLPCGIT